MKRRGGRWEHYSNLLIICIPFHCRLLQTSCECYLILQRDPSSQSNSMCVRMHAPPSTNLPEASCLNGDPRNASLLPGPAFSRQLTAPSLRYFATERATIRPMTRVPPEPTAVLASGRPSRLQRPGRPSRTKLVAATRTTYASSRPGTSWDAGKDAEETAQTVRPTQAGMMERARGASFISVETRPRTALRSAIWRTGLIADV